MLEWCYMHEKPLPIALEDIVCEVGITLNEGKRILSPLLDRFFTPEEDGWHNRRVDAEIARYKLGEPARLAKKARVKERVTKHRKDRSTLFALLATAGCHMPWTTQIKQLREVAQRMDLIVAGEAPETALQRHNGSLPEQVPVTREPLNQGTITSRVSGETLPYIIGSPIDIVRLVRAQGINGNWHDPRLIALINAGATRDEFESAAVQAKARKAADLWAYTLGVVSGRRKDAARMAQEGTKTGAGGANGSKLVRSIVPSLATPLKPEIPGEVIDVESKRLD